LKTLIIPDIHTKFDIAETIIDKETPDNIVFLGDYFDSFYDSLDVTEQTALWLKDSLEKENRIHLLGNHDLSYLHPDTHLCSGYSTGKLWVIKKVDVDLSKLQHYCWVGNWLCTHAGLSNEFYRAYKKENESPNDFLQRHTLDSKLIDRLYDCSPSRGGRNTFSGIVWCDYHEFVDIPNEKQIFGHTRRNVRQTKNHICIDTGLQNYAIHEDGKMTIEGTS